MLETPYGRKLPGDVCISFRHAVIWNSLASHPRVDACRQNTLSNYSMLLVIGTEEIVLPIDGVSTSKSFGRVVRARPTAGICCSPPLLESRKEQIYLVEMRAKLHQSLLATRHRIAASFERLFISLFQQRTHDGLHERQGPLLGHPRRLYTGCPFLR